MKILPDLFYKTIEQAPGKNTNYQHISINNEMLLLRFTDNRPSAKIPVNQSELSQKIRGNVPHSKRLAMMEKLNKILF